MTVKNIKGREERPIKESQKEGGGLQPEEKPLEKPYLRPGLGRVEQRSLPAHGSNIRTSQLTQPRVWGCKMIKCCLVWVQSNKSSLTEVTLSLEQVCRSICQGSDKSKCWNQVCCAFWGCLLQSPRAWTGHLSPAVGQQFLHFSQQIYGVKHPGEVYVSSSLSDTHVSSTEALWMHTERMSGVLLQENNLFHSAIALNLAGAAEVARDPGQNRATFPNLSQ